MKSWKWLISVGLVVCLVMAFALPMCAPAPPVEEEAPPVVEEELASFIRAYWSTSPEFNTQMAAFVKEKLGVAVRQRFQSCGAAHAKLIAEAPRFSADMVIACGPQAVDAKKEGWSIPYDSPVWRGESAEWKGPDNEWWNCGTIAFVLVGNKDMLDAAGYTLPESWDELLDPKWKGHIVMSSPLTSGTAFRMLYSFMWLYGFNAGKGEEGLWEFYEALDKNIHHYTKGGDAPTDLVGRGEFMLGITNAKHVFPRIQAGYPLVWTCTKEGTGYGATYLFILKGTEEEYTCQKIVDLFGSPEFCQLRADMGFVTKDPEATTALFGEEGAEYIPNIDVMWAFENKARLCEEWKERIGGVAK